MLYWRYIVHAVHAPPVDDAANVLCVHTQVDILDPSTAGLRAVYLFRDPIDTEAIKSVVSQETLGDKQQ